MYQYLLNRIIYDHNDDTLADNFYNKIFDYITDTNHITDIRFIINNKVLIIDDSVSQVYTFLLKASYYRDYGRSRWIPKIVHPDLKSFISRASNQEIEWGPYIMCANCGSTISNLMVIEHYCYLCNFCIEGIQSGGKINTKYDLRFLDFPKHGNITNFWYTINKSSLKLFCFMNNDHYRIDISLIDKLTNTSLKCCYSDTFNVCKICNSKHLVNKCLITGLYKCTQCYNIFNYRNVILIKFIIPKLLVFYNVNDVNYDIKFYIAYILLQMTL